MDYMVLTFIFILGLIIGSFLNVVILRYGTKKSISKGSSQCPRCQKKLKWYELIPVLSYLFLRGKCTNCHKKISIQYPLVELTTGFVFLFNFKVWIPVFSGVMNTNLWLFILTTLALCFLIIIFVYDLYHKIIPDEWSYTFGGLSLIYLFINFSGFDLMAPILLFLPFYLLWRISNGTWIGLGDGKLAFGIGGFLGFAYGISALVLSFWIGALYAVLIMLIDRLSKGKKNITMKSEIAFGPFMIIGFLIVYFYQIDVIGITYLLNGF